MSAVEQPEPGDDLMAIADAVGVSVHPETLLNYRPDPAHRHELSDTGLAAVLSNWSRAAAGIDTDLSDEIVDYWPVQCTACGDTGVASMLDRNGNRVTVTCWSCGGAA